MSGQIDRPRPMRGLWGCGLAMALLVSLVLVGCNGRDHRMSLGEFVVLEPLEEDVPRARPMDGATLREKLGPYRLGPGDVLAVNVTPAEQAAPVPPTQVRVSPKGTVELPLVGALEVAGLTLEQAEERIHTAYVPDFHRQASVFVQLVEAMPTRVMVIGAVAAPGLVELRRTERNLLYAVVQAGGASPAGSGRVTLQRLADPSNAVTLNIRDPEGLRKALSLDPLENGDIVVVHAATPNTIYVNGLVNSVYPQVYPPGTDVTVLQALAAAGGLRMDLWPREATLIRRVDDQDYFVRLDLKKIYKGLEPNIELQAGDILMVPHTWDTRLEEWAARNLYIRAGAAASAGATYNVIGTQERGDARGDGGGDTVFIAP